MEINLNLMKSIAKEVGAMGGNKNTVDTEQELSIFQEKTGMSYDSYLTATAKNIDNGEDNKLNRKERKEFKKESGVNFRKFAKENGLDKNCDLDKLEAYIAKADTARIANNMKINMNAILSSNAFDT